MKPQFRSIFNLTIVLLITSELVLFFLMKSLVGYELEEIPLNDGGKKG